MEEKKKDWIKGLREKAEIKYYVPSDKKTKKIVIVIIIIFVLFPLKNLMLRDFHGLG